MKKTGALLLVLVALTVLPVRAVSPPLAGNQPVGVQRFDLNGEWSFAADPRDVGEREEWARPGVDLPEAEEVSVPHTWNTMAAWRDYEGIAWYRKAFVGPRTVAGQQVRLVFDAVFYLAKVWLNGALLGTHEGGYTRFEFDVTKPIEPGELNIILVRVDNRRAYDRVPATLSSTWSYDWWGYGGLVRDVYLVATGPVAIHHAHVTAIPEKGGAVRIEVRAFIDNATGGPVAVELFARILPASGGGYLAGPAVRPTVPAGRGEVSFSFVVPKLKPWHFDQPSLCRLELTVSAKELGSSGYWTTFGLRRVEIKGTGLYINGERVRLAGVTRHADSAWYGLAEPAVMMARDWDDLKRLNTTLTRPVHYPQHEYILDYCDRNGILLIPEVPAWQLDANQMSNPKVIALVKQQLREMIETDYNHPCIWAWSLANEIASTTQAGKQFIKDLYDYVRTLDPTRYVSFASNHLDQVRSPADEATDYVDFIMMNQYFGTWAGRKQDLEPTLDRIHRVWPDRMTIVSEFGYEPNWPFGPRPTDTGSYYVAPAAASALEHDEQRQAVIADQLRIFRARDYIAGAIFWSYADYRTPAKFCTGLADAERNPLPSYFLLAEEYAPATLTSLVAMATRADGVYAAELVLRARGPVEKDLPAYTLRGYRLRWSVLDIQGRVGWTGEGPLPEMAPGAVWKYTWEYEAPSPHQLRVEVIRPTGFVILSRTIKVAQ